MTGIEQAVKMAGGQAELASLLDPAVTQQAISKWVTRGWVPTERAAEIEKLWAIPLRDLVSPALVEVVK